MRCTQRKRINSKNKNRVIENEEAVHNAKTNNEEEEEES